MFYHVEHRGLSLLFMGGPKSCSILPGGMSMSPWAHRKSLFVNCVLSCGIQGSLPGPRGWYKKLQQSPREHVHKSLGSQEVRQSIILTRMTVHCWVLLGDSIKGTAVKAGIGKFLVFWLKPLLGFKDLFSVDIWLLLAGSVVQWRKGRTVWFDECFSQ